MIQIAYIEPDEASRFTFEQITVLLKARGITNELQLYASFDTALAQIPYERPQIVFVNLRQYSRARLTGADLVRELRQHPLCRHVVIIGLAEYAMPADESAARAAGCTDFLPKPVRYQAVEDLIVRYLALRVDR